MSGTLPLAPAVAIETASAIIASPVRRRYAKRIDAEATAPLSPGPPIDVSVASFAQESDVPELVVTVRSFLSYVGVPREFVVVSDGTITDESRARVCSILPQTIEVQSIEQYAGATVSDAVRDLMAKNPLGGKLASLIAACDRAPALYMDADVLWFQPASDLRARCESDVPLYLLDVGPYLEQQMLPDQALAEVALPVNSGMLFVPRAIDWTLSLSRLSLVNGEVQKYSEQTAVHLAFHGAGAQPFPPDRYIVSPLRMRPHLWVRRRDVCARHYTGPQRGLFWLKVGRSNVAERFGRARRRSVRVSVLAKQEPEQASKRESALTQLVSLLRRRS